MIVYIKQVSFRGWVAELDDIVPQHLDEHALDKEMHIVSSAVSVERPENCDGKFISFRHVEHIFLCRVLAH